MLYLVQFFVFISAGFFLEIEFAALGQWVNFPLALICSWIGGSFATRHKNQRRGEYCCCCGDVYPIQSLAGNWTHDTLQSLAHTTPTIRYMFRHCQNGSHGGGYLCGKCYFRIAGEPEKQP